MDLDQLFVLAIEPSKLQRSIIVDCLKKTGIQQIEEFSDGQSALEYMDGQVPDLVISSMHLPDMTGTDVLSKMREDTRLSEITFLLISSETHYRYLEPIRQSGAVAILPKPFQQEELQRALVSTTHYIDDQDTDISESDDFEHLNLLVVDDSRMSRRYIHQMLEGIGIGNIIEAKDGAEGLQLMKHTDFDLVITDYNMPNVDGKEFVEHIRRYSNQRDVPVVMVTSEQNESRLAAIQSAGVSAICNKPFSYGNVKQLILNLAAEGQSFSSDEPDEEA